MNTNIELFGTEFEQKIKEESAKTESIWLNLDTKTPNLYIWKVMNFKLIDIKKENIGMFYEGDSYIVFNIQKDLDGSIKYNIHFWLGNLTTADEMGVAAYKTVELDTFLKGKPVQFREVQGHESDLFRSYFPQGITYKLGGVESGFKKVQKEDYSNYKPLLYRVKNIAISYMSQNEYVSEEDSYMLDKGLEILIYLGKKSSNMEKLLLEYNVSTIRDSRINVEIKNVSDLETFQKIIGEIKLSNNHDISLKRITGNTLVSANSLDTNDAFLLKTPDTTFIWIGKHSSYTELLNAWKIAFEITQKTSSISLIKEGSETEIFKMLLKNIIG